jgi:hypothetical protein
MSKISGWKLMGESATHDLVAGVLPANGMHFLIAPNEDERRAIVADMCVAIASGNIGTLVQDGKKSIDGWRIESGFFGLDVGKQNGVAIIEAAGHTDVKTAAAWRGVKSDLPIAISTASKSDIVSARLHDLRGEMNVGLVIVAANWSRGVDEVKRILNYRGDFAVLVVSATEPPANVIGTETRVLRAENGQLSIAHPATAKPWSAPFTLEPIRMASGQAYGVRAGSEAASVPEIVRAAPEAPQPREAYAGVVVYAVGARSYGLHPSEAVRWPEGTIFAEQPEEVAEAAREIAGKVQIIVALGMDSKADANEERRRVQTACEMAKIGDRVDVGVASRTLLDARDVAGRTASAA